MIFSPSLIIQLPQLRIFHMRLLLLALLQLSPAIDFPLYLYPPLKIYTLDILQIL